MIPHDLRPLFWDTNIENFNPADYPAYTIARVLEFGDEKAIAWLKATFSESQIVEVVRTERRLSRKSANFWALVYNTAARRCGAPAGASLTKPSRIRSSSMTEKQEPVWHPETIAHDVLQTIRDLQRTTLLASFYLAGGTGLALRLGHRRSADLDFFSVEGFSEDTLIQTLAAVTGFSVVSKAPGTLHTQIRNTKVSFLVFAYPLLFPCEAFLDIRVADPRDIACMKLNAIASRGTKRDFIDLFAVSQKHELQQILTWFQQKFAAANYNVVHLLKSLTYFDDAEKDPPPDMLLPVSWEEIRRYFRREVPRLL
jgi:hypothetical protein